MSEQQGPSNSKGKGVVRSSGDTSALEQNIEQSMADITAMRTSEEDYPDTKIKNVRGIISRAFPLPEASAAKRHSPPPSHVIVKGSEEFEEEAVEFRDEFLSSTKPESQSSSDHEEISYNTGDLSFLRDQVRRELESEYREALGKIKEIDRVQREDFKNALYRDVAEMVSDTMKAALVDGHIAHKGDFEYLKEENKRLMSELKKTREEMASAQQTLLNDARTDRQEYHRVLTALSDSLTELVTQISRGTPKKIEEAHVPAILETAEKLKTDTQAALHNLSQKGFHNVPPIAPIPRPVIPSSSVTTVPAGRIRRKIEEKKLWE